VEKVFVCRPGLSGCLLDGNVGLGGVGEEGLTASKSIVKFFFGRESDGKREKECSD